MTKPLSTNPIQPQTEARLQKRAFAVWLTGLPCSGKTTLANALRNALMERGAKPFVMDGDDLRKGLNKDLGYTPDDRKENIRRAAEATKLLNAAGVITLNCFITPTQELRKLVKQIVGDETIEVFVKCPVEICEQRDVKGMYRKARNGELKDFTGVSALFEEPQNADIMVDTSILSVEQCVDKLMEVVDPRLKQFSTKPMI